MEARITRLEESVVDIRVRLTAIETRLDQTATKTDLADLKVAMHKGFADMIKWVVGTAIVLGATGITVITFVLDHASP
jgi:phage shock protein A